MSRPNDPIQNSVDAKSHRPVYRMHRYFARRPYSVFQNLVSYYTEPNDIVLDPFCGGGVTLVEGILQGRRVAGCDINPLATFITKMQLLDVDIDRLAEAQNNLISDFKPISDEIFSTKCRKCKSITPAKWIEHTAICFCNECKSKFQIIDAEKPGIGRWSCTNCNATTKFSCDSQTLFKPSFVYYDCHHCGHDSVDKASRFDIQQNNLVSRRLAAAEKDGLSLPISDIPVCNMERESALHKKGIDKFRQLFTDRHLLSLALLRNLISESSPKYREWLYFTFSATLRYTNRMTTRNAAWRGNRPLEWAKPGYWLPPVHLEANVLEELTRRGQAILRGKKDYLEKIPTSNYARHTTRNNILLDKNPAFLLKHGSSTKLDFPDSSIDCIITDPPYGSYVHYADLSNFWSSWLDNIPGLGNNINNNEEAVIARKKFPGAKDTANYQSILEQCFIECSRVLKPDRFLVMTFNNREPRAWFSVIAAALKAGFTLPTDGVIFQDGISSYKHTSQSRRQGSVIGDFIFSFKKSSKNVGIPRAHNNKLSPDFYISIVRKILNDSGPLDPNQLMTQFYLRVQPIIVSNIRLSLRKNGDIDELLEEADKFTMFDSHRRDLLEEHFDYQNGQWQLRINDGKSLAIS